VIVLRVGRLFGYAYKWGPFAISSNLALARSRPVKGAPCCLRRACVLQQHVAADVRVGRRRPQDRRLTVRWHPIARSRRFGVPHRLPRNRYTPCMRHYPNGTGRFVTWLRVAAGELAKYLALS
jgi:hypothetical protein